MAHPPQRTRSVAEWTIGEVLLAFVEWLLSPALGLAAAMQAYIQSSDFTVALVIGAIVFGMVAHGINQSRQVLVASTVRGRLVQIGADVAQVADAATMERGYVARITFLNMSDMPIEYHVEETAFLLDERASREGNGDGTLIGILLGRTPGVHRTGPVVLGERKDEILKGTIRLKVRYGRPGRLRHMLDLRLAVVAQTNETGAVRHTDSHRMDGDRRV